MSIVNSLQIDEYVSFIVCLSCFCVIQLIVSEPEYNIYLNEVCTHNKQYNKY